ncbi:hypothetical protein Misp02_41440 [Microtetraspora sp. NBRC 16547]|nr:hypothetical protein Misp02_41440 [Microtetraspora sp. NBRC 16547]
MRLSVWWDSARWARAAMKRGVGLPMGPFTLLDLIGLDTSYEVCEVLFRETHRSQWALLLLDVLLDCRERCTAD